MPDLYPRLWRFALSLTRDPALADDLAQAAVTRGIERAAQFDPESRLDHWMFRILRSIWLNELRARRVRTGRGLVAVEDAELTDPGAGPELTVYGREVLTHIAALPEAQREAVMLVYVEGFRYREAAEILDIPVGTVMSRLAAARKNLRGTLSKDIAAQ